MNRLIPNAAKTIAMLGMFAWNSMDAAHAQVQSPDKQSAAITKTEQIVNAGTASRFVEGEEKQSLVVVLGRDTLVVQPDPQGEAHFAIGNRSASKIKDELVIRRGSTRYFMNSAEEAFNPQYEFNIRLDSYSEEDNGSVVWKRSDPDMRALADKDINHISEDLQAVGVIAMQLPLIAGDTTDTGEPNWRYISNIILVNAQGDTLIAEKNNKGLYIVSPTFDEEGNSELYVLEQGGNKHYKGSTGIPLDIRPVRVSLTMYDPKLHGEYILWLNSKSPPEVQEKPGDKAFPKSRKSTSPYVG